MILIVIFGKAVRYESKSLKNDGTVIYLKKNMIVLDNLLIFVYIYMYISIYTHIFNFVVFKKKS